MIIQNSVIKMSCFFLFGIVVGCSVHSSDMEKKGGITRINLCPKSPNCVSSLDLDDQHFIAPLSYTGSKKVAYRTLVDIIESEPRARIVTMQTNYIRFESKTKVFGFIDDVEFFFSPDKPVIHLRSASRKGYYDFGVNRRRIEGIRKLFDAGLNR